MFGSIGMPELIIILVIALIIFGPRKLPELGKSLGRSLNEFKRASAELQNTLEQEIKLEEQKERQVKATDTLTSASEPDSGTSDPAAPVPAAGSGSRRIRQHCVPQRRRPPVTSTDPLERWHLVPVPGAAAPEPERSDVTPYSGEQPAGRNAACSTLWRSGRGRAARRADDVSRASRRAPEAHHPCRRRAARRLPRRVRRSSIASGSSSSRG